MRRKRRRSDPAATACPRFSPCLRCTDERRKPTGTAARRAGANGLLGVRAAAVRVRPDREPRGSAGGAPGSSRAGAGVPASFPPLPRPAQRPPAAAAGASDRGQPRQPPRCPRADLGVSAGARQPRAQPLRQGLLLPPSAQADDRLFPGQHDPHGPQALRRAGDRLLPRADGPGGQHHPVPRGHALARRIAGALPGGRRPAGAEVPHADRSGLHPRGARVLPEGGVVSAARADRGDLRLARSVSRHEKLQAQLAGRRPRRRAAGPPVGLAGLTGANTR